ncbi:recombinase family protein [Anoxybacillus sp. ST4]|uniref:recombinase family protein n=2 Tax=Anoxybacillus TaxID=150247 RepID=UPI00351D7EAB
MVDHASIKPAKKSKSMSIHHGFRKLGYRTKRGKHFSINTIATILDNPLYVGKISWLKVENWDEKRRKGQTPIL